MNKAQLARYEKLLNGDAGTKSMNIPRLGFKFDLKQTEDLRLRKRQDSGSDSHNSNDIELLFPDNDQVFQGKEEEMKEPSASDQLT